MGCDQLNVMQLFCVGGINQCWTFGVCDLGEMLKMYEIFDSQFRVESGFAYLESQLQTRSRYFQALLKKVSTNSGKGNPQNECPRSKPTIFEPGKSESCQFVEKRAFQEAAGKAISKV
jgi:hypothetical protein